jgi:YebC/PmpR family DNA-binding regulatory protein
MAGHSKWANIKYKKERADQKRGKLFSRIAKEIISAVKQGGVDPKANAKLKLALQKAKQNNMPKENIERNIKKAVSKEQKDYFEMSYELYGHGGVGIIADVMTDNRNRIAGEVRGVISKCGGVIASKGAVSFNFDRKGVIQVNKKNAIEDELFLYSVENGAEEFEREDGFYIITASPNDLYRVKKALEDMGVVIESFSLEMIPKNLVECSKEGIEANNKLIEKLEEIEDVDAVFHNMLVS